MTQSMHVPYMYWQTFLDTGMPCKVIRRRTVHLTKMHPVF